MELQKVKIADLQPHPENYNTHPEAQISELMKSLEMFDQFKNIVVCQGRIIAGHGLVEAAKRKGITEIYALIRDDLTEEQQKALLVADNAMPFLALPDTAALEELLSSLSFDIPGVTDEWLNSIGLTDFTFSQDQTPGQNEDENPYSKKITAPVYQPVNEKPQVSELFDTNKSHDLIEEIKAANIQAEEKTFLIEAAKRHTVFNYRKIADYYAHSAKPVQELMEKSALVIIDFDKAIENGYVKLSQDIADQYLEEYSDDNE